MELRRPSPWFAGTFLSAASLAFLAAWASASFFALGAETQPSQPRQPAAEADAESDPDLALAGRMERAFQKLAQRLAPCVVSIQVHVGSDNWQETLRRLRQQFDLERQLEGSGVIVEPTGYIITNEHVIHGAEKIHVKLWDGRVFGGAVCGTDPRSDLAMLRLSGENLPTDLPCVELADSGKVAVGQYALAVGNPFGLSNSLTMGVVSALGRCMPVRDSTNDIFLGNLIQTDAVIDPGNSGGPLFNLRGKLIGINTMILSYTGVSTRCGFAIPSNHLQKRLALLKAGREIQYGWLGIVMKELGPGQKEFKVPDNKGVLIDSVLPDTPADRAGMEQGMVILEYDGTKVSSIPELMGAVNDTLVGHVVNIKVLDRAGRAAGISVRIAKRNSELVLAANRRKLGGSVEAAADLDEDLPPDETPAPNPLRPAIAGKAQQAAKFFTWRGLQVKELSAEEGRRRGGRIEVVHVKRGSPADHAGLYEGAIITEMKHAGSAAIAEFKTLGEFKRIADGVSGAAALYIHAEGYVTVQEK